MWFLIVSVPDICPFSYYIKYSVSKVRSSTDSAPIMAPFPKINVLSLKSRARSLKVKKKAKTRNQFNQVPNLTRVTIWESGKHTRKYHTQEWQEVSHLPAGDHKAGQHNKNKRETLTGL